jgi:hypothetical protein
MAAHAFLSFFICIEDEQDLELFKRSSEHTGNPTARDVALALRYSPLVSRRGHRL